MVEDKESDGRVDRPPFASVEVPLHLTKISALGRGLVSEDYRKWDVSHLNV